MMNDEWHSAVIEFGCISPTVHWINFMFSKVKVCVMVVYGPTEGEAEEKEKFWSDLDRVCI